MTLTTLPWQCHAVYRPGVARTPRDFEIESVHVPRREEDAQIRTGTHTAAPAAFTAYIQLKRPALELQMRVRVDQAGTRPRLIDLHISCDPRAAITTSMLRQVLIDQLLRAALNKASVAVEAAPDMHPYAFRVADGPSDTAWVSPPLRPQGRGRRTSDELARESARIYSDAVTRGSRAPAVAVANAMGRSRAQVARYIRRARELKLLPPLEKLTEP